MAKAASSRIPGVLRALGWDLGIEGRRDENYKRLAGKDLQNTQLGKTLRKK
jgi:hypothetical protein